MTAVNAAPVAVNDTASTSEDTPVSVAAPGLLGNDTDADGQALTATLVGAPAHGTVTLNANGSFTYTPAANYNGADSFTYKASDGTADSNVATVSITIAAVERRADGRRRRVHDQRGHRARRVGTGRAGQRHRCRG